MLMSHIFCEPKEELIVPARPLSGAATPIVTCQVPATVVDQGPWVPRNSRRPKAN